jgi:hypothetical protein
VEGRFFCLPEILGINKRWPFSKLGWSIGVIAIKEVDEVNNGRAK